MKYRKNGTDTLCGQCDLCRGCLADFAAQILAAYEVVGGEADA